MIVTNEELELANKLALVDTDMLAGIFDRLGDRLIEIASMDSVKGNPGLEDVVMELHGFVTIEADNLREG